MKRRLSGNYAHEVMTSGVSLLRTFPRPEHHPNVSVSNRPCQEGSMVKPKYYPHITLAAAIALLLLPASMLLLISSPEAQSVDELIAAADSENPASDAASLIPQTPTASPQVEQRPATRVAMLAPNAGDQVIALNSQHRAFDQVPTLIAANPNPKIGASADSAMLATEISEQPAARNVPPGTEMIASNASNPEAQMESSEQQSTEDDTLNQELEAAIAKRSSTDDSHFDSTGHLAMSGRMGQSDSSRLGTTRSPRSAKSKQSKMDQQSNSETGDPVLLDEDPFSSEPKNPIVDMLIQQPSERRPVSKVENLVATTQQPGWPIALVRSDLPDDVWWVQQMVGIRHRSFASRVNFGNDSSLPGSVYHLVIVFLDSADEARRFRIAKQFKDLPEGLRRSREYTFVRK